MIQIIKNYIEKNEILHTGEHVLLGVSGGADSVCLLDVLDRLKGEYQLKLTVVHVEHGIRGEQSLKDMAYVEQLCDKKGIPCICEQHSVKEYAKERGMTEEEAGREIRYEAFYRLAKKVGADKIAVAHHANDLAETMLFFLSRGTALAGLSPMGPVRGNIIRPLLCVTREEIQEYLSDRGLSYCIDETNQSLEYARNRIRNAVMPQLQKINDRSVQHFAQTAESLAMAEEVLEEVTDKAFEKMAREVKEGWFIREELKVDVKPYLQYQVILRAMEAVCGKRKDIERIHLTQILDLFALQVGRQLDMPYAVKAVREYGGILITRQISKDDSDDSCIEEKTEGFLRTWEVPVNGELDLGNGKILRTRLLDAREKLENIPSKSYTKWFDYDIIKDNLCIRECDRQDYLVIDDKGGRKKIKKLFVDEKIPRKSREQVLVLANSNHVYWALGIRMGEDVKVTDQTKWIMEITLDGGRNYERNN